MARGRKQRLLETAAREAEARQMAELLLPRRLERIGTVAAHRTRALTVVLDRVQNAHNISAVMRSCDAFGVQDLHMLSSGADLSRQISLGSESWLTVHRYAAPEALLETLRAGAYRLVTLKAPPPGGTVPDSIPVFELPFGERLALVFGNERDGVSPEIAAACGLRAHIPMCGFVESFNISVAAAITLFCSTISGARGERRPAIIAAGEQEELRSAWVKLSVRQSDRVLAQLRKRQA